MAMYNNVSYPDPDELPNVPWASHLVTPAAEVSENLADHDGTSPAQSTQDADLSYHASRRGNTWAEAQQLDSNGPQSTRSIDDRSVDSVRELEHEPGAGRIDLDIEFNSESEGSDSDYSSSSEENAENTFANEEMETEPPPARGRGRGRPRGSRGSRGRGRGRGRGGFKGLLEDIDRRLGVEKAKRGRGRPRARGASTKSLKRQNARRKAKGTLPSQEFKQLHEEASRAYIEGDYDRAEDAISQAIEKNPEISTVHSLLAEILEAKGEKVRAPWVLFAGAHVRPRDPQAWLEAADGIREFMSRQTAVELEQVVKEDEKMQTTLYAQCTTYMMHCYSRCLSLDRSNHETRKRRALLFRELGDPKKAFKDYKSLLDRGVTDPFRDPETLHYIADKSLEMFEPNKGIEIFELILRFKNEPENVAEALEWSHISLLAELYISAVRPENGLVTVKKFARLLLGRGDQDNWDNWTEDDREFDLNDEPRRIEFEGFDSSRGAFESHGAGLPIDLRVKLGVLRLKMDNLDEAMQHFNWIKYDEDHQSVEDFAEYYLEAANALHTAAKFDEALRFYEPVIRASIVLDSDIVDRLAHCYEKNARYDEAEELYLMSPEEVGDLSSIEKLARMFSRAKLPDRAGPYLQRLSEDRRKRLRMMELQLSDAQYKRRELDEAGHSSSEGDLDDDIDLIRSSMNLTHPPGYKHIRKPISYTPSKDPLGGNRRDRLPKANGVSMTQKQQLRELDQDEVHLAFMEMETYQKSLQSHRDEWIDIASKVLRVFRSQKVFYPHDKNQRFFGYTTQARAVSKKAKSYQELLDKEVVTGNLEGATDLIDFDLQDVPNEFCHVSFSSWLDTFLQYAVFVAIDGRHQEAFDTCQAAADANVFIHSELAMKKIHNVWMACAAISDDQEAMEKMTRLFMRQQQFVGDSYRLYGALNLVKKPPNTTFNASHNQKFILRHIKLMDFELFSEEEKLRRERDFANRARLNRFDPETGEAIHPTEVSCELLMTYALMLYTGQSHNEGLFYMLRVHATKPNDPLLNLLIGLCYFGCAFKRQSANRQFQIMQGLAMVKQYYDIRMTSENLIDRQEAEFNMASSYQVLGLTHLCIPHFEKCLLIGEELAKSPTQENFGVEAAYALSNIWAASGRMEMAEEVTEKWLVL